MRTVQESRELVEAALAYCQGTHGFEDVVREVEDGEAQFWPGPNSMLVTQLDRQPQRTILLFWLAAGEGVEIRAMVPKVLEWGRENGATLARFVGRKGWLRSFVVEDGWQPSEFIIMERGLDAWA